MVTTNILIAIGNSVRQSWNAMAIKTGLGGAQVPGPITPAEIFLSIDQQPTIKRRPHPQGSSGKAGGS